MPKKSYTGLTLQQVAKFSEKKVQRIIDRKNNHPALDKKPAKPKPKTKPTIVEQQVASPPPRLVLQPTVCIKCRHTISKNHPHYPANYRPELGRPFLCIICFDPEPRKISSVFRKTIIIKHSSPAEKIQSSLVSFDEYSVRIVGPYAPTNKLSRWIKDVLNKTGYRDKLLPMFKPTSGKSISMFFVTGTEPWMITIEGDDRRVQEIPDSAV